MALINTVIFSKDRACQLEALLRSLREQVPDWKSRGLWSVVFTASSPRFDEGYRLLRENPATKGVEFLDERAQGAPFADLVRSTMRRQRAANGAQHCMFLVDDMLFKAPWPQDGGKPMRRLLKDKTVLCLSLRMCKRYDYCYARRKDMKLPRFDWWGRWNWTKSRLDWGYPMSVDGHVFRYDDLLPLVERVSFRHPNSFEAALAENPIRQRPRMVCYPEAVVVNLPINLVQTELKNRAGEQHGISTEALNDAFLAGRRVDLAPVYALRDNRGCHHELSVHWL